MKPLIVPGVVVISLLVLIVIGLMAWKPVVNWLRRDKQQNVAEAEAPAASEETPPVDREAVEEPVPAPSTPQAVPAEVERERPDNPPSMLEWKKHTCAAGGFEVMLAGKVYDNPLAKAVTAQLPDRSKILISYYSPIRNQTQAGATSHAESFIRALNGEVLERRTLSIGDKTGVEFWFEAEAESGPTAGRCVSYLANGRPYLLIWTGPQGYEPDYNLDTCFYSFRAVAVQTPQAPEPRNQAVVVFEVTAYRGSGDPTAAARRAPQGIPWVDSSRLSVDVEKGEVVIGVLGWSVATVAAKMSLQRAGFVIGKTTYHGSGR